MDNYLKEAFLRPANLTALGVAAFCSVIAVGMGGWPLLIFPVAAEILYLRRRSRSPRFRIWVRKTKGLGGALMDNHARDELTAQLDAQNRSRYRRFQKTYHDILEKTGNESAQQWFLVEESLRKIEGMRDGYLRLLHAYHRSVELLRRTDEKALRNEMEDEKRKLESAHGEAAEIREKNLGLITERLEHLDKVKNEVEVIKAQLELMENTLALLRDKALTMEKPADIDTHLELAVQNMSDAEIFSDRMENLLAGTLNRTKF